MGRNLFIRVSAVTYDEKRVAEDWPDLCDLVWPVPGKDPAREKVAKAFGGKERGVLQLAAGLLDILEYGDLSEARSARLAPLGKALKAHLAGLEEALGNRDVHKAYTLTNVIEDTLDAMEAALRGK